MMFPACSSWFSCMTSHDTHPLTGLLRLAVPRRQCCSPGTAWQSLHSLTGSHSQGGLLWRRHAVQPAAHTQPILNPCTTNASHTTHTQPILNPYSTHTQPIHNPYSTHTQPILNPYSTHTQPIHDPYMTRTQPICNPYAALLQRIHNPYTTHDD